MASNSPQQRELLQISICKVLDANRSRFGMPLDAITLHTASSWGFPKVKREDVEAELDYLVAKGLVEVVSKTLEPANRAWRLTASGRDYLSERE
jgi:hypothetical protein